MNENLKGQDVLLVREKGSSELNVAKMGGDGKVKQVKRCITLIFNDYFFLFFRKTVRIFALEFYADRDRTKVDKQDTLNKPQIVPHKTETTTYLAVFQTNKKSNKSPDGGKLQWRGGYAIHSLQSGA
ncbi:MAG: hypothetical protein LBL33_06565, partial [Tannerella sp.]|nr:hypothetical protein [Tannerella sp.]